MQQSSYRTNITSSPVLEQRLRRPDDIRVCVFVCVCQTGRSPARPDWKCLPTGGGMRPGCCALTQRLFWPFCDSLSSDYYGSAVDLLVLLGGCFARSSIRQSSLLFIFEKQWKSLDDWRLAANRCFCQRVVVCDSHDKIRLRLLLIFFNLSVFYLIPGNNLNRRVHL